MAQESVEELQKKVKELEKENAKLRNGGPKLKPTKKQKVKVREEADRIRNIKL